MDKTKILILGGYGNFGKRITENLAVTTNVVLMIAGRNIDKAEKLIRTTRTHKSTELMAIRIDCNGLGFEEELKSLNPDLVIHTSGPFQGQSYGVAKACIEIGSHYIDLADDRRFVCDISQLSEQAEKKNVVIISGASTVPGLSSVVVDYYKNEFEVLENVDMAIAPGNKAERGEATIRAILTYTGKPFKVLINGSWEKIYGWMDSRKVDFGGFIGKRRLANVDVPELELFVKRYPTVKTVKFQAGLELGVLHYAMLLMAFMAKIKLIRNWAPSAKIITKLSNSFNRFGTDQGGMRVVLKGKDIEGNRKALKWVLFADKGIGPYIPTLSAIILARKLIDGKSIKFGANPCLGMYSLKEFDNACEKLNIYHSVEIENG